MILDDPENYFGVSWFDSVISSLGHTTHFTPSLTS